MKSRAIKLTFILLCFALAPAPKAVAAYYNFKCQNETQIEFYDALDSSWIEGLRVYPRGPAVVRLQSHGGLIAIEEMAANQFQILAQTVLLHSKTKLKVIVAGSCASACTILLARLNHLAGQKQINLYVDKETQLGFHAGVMAKSRAIFPAASLFPYFKRYGVPQSWLNENIKTFSSPAIKWVSPRDPWLQRSRIISHAILVDKDISDSPIPSNAQCIAGPCRY